MNTLIYEDGLDERGEIKIFKSDAEGSVVEIDIPIFKEIENDTEEGTFQTLTIPGFGQSCEPGKPQLPVKGFLFASPVNAQPSIKILAADFQTFSNYNIPPTPTPSLDQDFEDKKELPLNNVFQNRRLFDPNVYNSDTFYPEEIVKIGEHGFVRNQYVYQLQIFPVQYNPVSKEIKWYRKIKIEISFEKSDSDRSSDIGAENNSPAFETILRNSLLNYEQAKAWRRTADKTKFFKGYEQPFLTEGLWLKIAIEQDGVYRLNKADLENAGLEVIRLKCGGDYFSTKVKKTK